MYLPCITPLPKPRSRRFGAPKYTPFLTVAYTGSPPAKESTTDGRCRHAVRSRLQLNLLRRGPATRRGDANGAARCGGDPGGGRRNPTSPGVFPRDLDPTARAIRGSACRAPASYIKPGSRGHTSSVARASTAPLSASTSAQSVTASSSPPDLLPALS